MHAACPFCAREVEVGDDQRGLKLECGRCRRTYRLPERDGDPAIPIGRVGEDGAVDAPKAPAPLPPAVPPKPKPEPESKPIDVVPATAPSMPDDDTKPWLVFGAVSGGVLLLLAIVTVLLHEHSREEQPAPPIVTPTPPDDPAGPTAIAGRVVLRDEEGRAFDGAGLTVTLHRAGLTLGPYRAEIAHLRKTWTELEALHAEQEVEFRALASTTADSSKAEEFRGLMIDARAYRDFATAKLDRIRETHFMNDDDPLTPHEVWKLFIAAPASVPAAYDTLVDRVAPEEAPLHRTLRETELARARADAAGAYRFDVEPGDYFVHALWTTQSRGVEWVVPATVRRDRTTPLDLGFENAARVVKRR